MMITMYGFGKVTPQVVGITRDLRVLWALEECELPHQVNGLDDVAGELHSADYLAINPFGKVPAIDHDGVIIFESGAIVIYLAEQSGRLLPTSESERAKALQWTFAALDTVEPPMTQIAVIDLFEADAEWATLRRPALVEMAKNCLAVLEDVLISKRYLLGDQFTYPDILMVAALSQIQHTNLLDEFPNVTSYLTRCHDRPAWHKCLDAYNRRLAA
ncbi:glutathione S-transferase family protein [Halomonas sp.]|uniref:glutathione S-transferase family protein n=1 Tax=Halomonas sp. TaxID=1486246 RepID=UPI003F8DE003